MVQSCLEVPGRWYYFRIILVIAVLIAQFLNYIRMVATAMESEVLSSSSLPALPSEGGTIHNRYRYQPTESSSSYGSNHYRHRNALLQGQFNYDLPSTYIHFWVETWSAFFENVIVVGPFSDETQGNLTKLGIAYRYEPAGTRDPSSPSCFANLMRTLLEIQDHRTIDGVLYLHDDLIVNLTNYTISGKFPKDTIIMNSPIHSPSEGLVEYRQSKHWIDITKDPYNASNRTIVFRDYDGQGFYTSWQGLYNRIRPNWDWNKWCLPTESNIAKFDDRIDDYLHNGTSWLLPGHQLVDNLWVPKMYISEFVKAASIHADNGNYLECAFPSILEMMRQKTTTFKIKHVRLCTTEKYYAKARSRPRMIFRCLRNGVVENHEFGVFHPIKIKYDMNAFRQMIQLVQGSSWESFDWTPYFSHK